MLVCYPCVYSFCLVSSSCITVTITTASYILLLVFVLTFYDFFSFTSFQPFTFSLPLLSLSSVFRVLFHYLGYVLDLPLTITTAASTATSAAIISAATTNPELQSVYRVAALTQRRTSSQCPAVGVTIYQLARYPRGLLHLPTTARLAPLLSDSAAITRPMVLPVAVPLASSPQSFI